MRLKKRLAFMLCIVCVFALVAVNVNAIDVYYNDTSAKLKGHTYVDNSIVMLPLREVAEDAQYIVKWDDDAQSAQLIKGNLIIDVPIGAEEIDVSGVKIKLSAPIAIKNDITYVPVDFIKNLTNAEINWNEKNSTLALNAKEFYSNNLFGSASLLNKVESRGLLVEYDYEKVTDASLLLLSKGGKYQISNGQLAVSDDAYGGYQALAVKSTSTSAVARTNMQRIVSDEILQNGKGKYRLAFKIKPLTEDQLVLIVNCQPGGASAFITKSIAYDGGYWGSFDEEFNVDPGSYTYFVVNIGTDKWGSTFLIDNLCFEKIS